MRAMSPTSGSGPRTPDESKSLDHGALKIIELSDTPTAHVIPLMRMKMAPNFPPSTVVNPSLPSHRMSK